MNGGKMDRLIRIEVATDGPLSDRGEAPQDPWTLLRLVWGSKTDLSGSEQVQAQQLAAKVSTEFEIRYPVGLNPMVHASERMRLVCEGKIYDITHVGEIGRREGLRILAWARAEAAAAA